MSDIPFAVHLGGGLYIDSTGALHQGAPPATPIYEAPFKLPVDPKKVKAALDDVKKAMEDLKKNEEVLKKFEEFGLLPMVLDIISVVTKVAGVVAPVLFVVSIVIDLIKLFGFMKDGPSALEQLITQRFDHQEHLDKAIAALTHIQDIRDGRIDVREFTNTVRNYVGQLQSSNPSIAQLESDRTRLLGEHSARVDGIAKLLDWATWMSVLDRNDHTKVWAALGNLIHTLPGGPGAAPQITKPPGQPVAHFDHRLMVPLASYAAEGYLTGIRGIEPEYRSTGLFRENLRNFARNLSELAQAMRQHSLARTIYKASDFSWTLAPYEVEITYTTPEGGIFPEAGAPVVSPKCSRFPVGALDLRYHDNNFFDQFLTDLWKAEFYGWPFSPKRAGLNLRWTPPAKLVRDGLGNYQITNPDECAAAANLQSEQDYAELLSLSGYTQLLQLAALLRHESTAPDRSQTVYARKPALYRDPQPSSNVTVQSESILFTGVISSPATREPQLCRARVEITTQPIKRARPIEYQIRLRTLRSTSGTKNHWSEPDYRKFHWTQYDPDLSEPTFLQMNVYQSDAALDAKLLMEGWHSSPRDEVLQAAGTVELRAHTFDWWIPVKSPFDIAVPFNKTVAELAGVGWSGKSTGKKAALMMDVPLFASTAGPMKTLSHDDESPWPRLRGPSIRDLIPELTWQAGQEKWEGEHREVKEEMVKVRYELKWEADQLTVQLWNDLEDRNYVVYLVIEEKLPVTGQVLHTATAVPMNGLLTYVPQKFFDDEREAWERAGRVIDYFNDKYSEQREVGPLDPVVGWRRPGDYASIEAREHLVRLAEQHAPEILEEAMAVVRREMRETTAV
jgi:hypothetical protein